MTSSNQTNEYLVEILQQFSKRYISAYQEEHGCLPSIQHDKDWPSLCEQSATKQTNATDGEVYWQPVIVNENDALSFDNVEAALELILHDDIKTYFTSLYSESLDAQSSDGGLSLLFAWNKDDFQRLQENIIGHILMKRRLKQAETIFFAVTDEEDMIISLDNKTGAVWVEQVGCKPHKQLSNTLAEFISLLTPMTK